MSKMMILGVKGETGLWLVDFEAGTVAAMEGNREDYISADAGTAAEAHSLEVAVPFTIKEEAASGVFFSTQAVDVAIPFGVKAEAASGVFFNAVDVAVPFGIKAEAASGHYYKGGEAQVIHS